MRYELRKRKVMEFLWDIDFYIQRLPFEIRCSEEIRKAVNEFMRRVIDASRKSEKH
jgi:hypothetical protein